MSDDMFYCSFVSIHYIICECGETFPSEDDLRTHLEVEHAHKKEKKEYKCGICEDLFSSEEACIEHYENAHLDIQAEHDYVEAYAHEEEVKDVDFKDIIEPCEDVKVLELSDLPRTVVTSRVRRRPDKKLKPNYNLIKNIVCEMCGKRYASNAALKYHQRVHTGERPYKCTICPKSFTMPLFLQVHVRTHTGERPYACPLCPKAFSNKAALLRHDRVHTGAKPYECPKCGKFFTQSNSMKLHVNTVHLKMPAPYKSRSRREKAGRDAGRDTLSEDTADVAQDETVETIDQSENTESNLYIKSEDDPLMSHEEEADVMLEDVGQEMITYEVIYEGQ